MLNKNRYLFGLALLASLLLALASCSKEEYDPIPEPLRHVFPLLDGKYRIYHAVDTNYESSVSGGKEGREYFKKELYNGEETDLLGRMVKRVEIQEGPYLLDSLGQPIFSFTPVEVWTQWADSLQAECTEGTQRILYLKLPPYVGTTWNGNLYNAEQPEVYQYLNVDTTVVANGVTWTHCVYVEEVPFDEIGEIRSGGYYRREHAYQVYAPYVGKIIRHRERVIYQGVVLDGASSHYLHEEIVQHNF